MISLLEKIFFRDRKIKQFIPVRIASDDILEKVIIKKGNKVSDVTQKHSIVAQTPFCVAICFSSEEANTFDDNSEMQILRDQKELSSLSLNHVHTIAYGNSFILIYEIVDVHNYSLGFIQRELLLRFSFRNKSTTYFERKVYAALYTFPRKIILVSYEEENYTNIFPMDFQCYITGANIYLLGLRTSNTTLNKIIQSKKLVVSDTALAEIDILYSLGKHHAKALDINELSFGLSRTDKYKFPLPDFALSYKELELVECYNAGSHVLLVAQVIHSNQLSKPNPNWHHIHFFHSNNAGYSST